MGTIRMRSFSFPWLVACVTFSISNVSAAQDVGPAFSAPVSEPMQEQLRPQQKWSIRGPKIEQITINGMVNLDGAGIASVPMMYPAPSAAGFLAGIVTHGIINGTAKRKQKQHLIDAADEVLAPYQPLIAAYTTKLLLQGSLERDALRKDSDRAFLIGEPSAADWLIVGEPAFRFSSDQRALLIDTAVTIYSPNSLETPVYKNIVRVVATPMEGPDAALMDSWVNDDGKLFKQTMEDLYAESLSLAIRAMPSYGAMTNVDPNAARTIRYALGANERMERGQLMFEDCDRAVIKTLYGTIMSVPLRSKGTSTVPGGCGMRTNPQDPPPRPGDGVAPAQAFPHEETMQPAATSATLHVDNAASTSD